MTQDERWQSRYDEVKYSKEKAGQTEMSDFLDIEEVTD